MHKSERATQIWAVLALAARNRQILTYDILGKAIGVPSRALAQLLGPIQEYCIRERLEPLTSIVVKQDSGLPGTGFIAAEDIPATQMRVFRFDWLEHGCPRIEDFDKASQK
jgi:hypothetical protein